MTTGDQQNVSVESSEQAHGNGDIPSVSEIRLLGPCQHDANTQKGMLTTDESLSSGVETATTGVVDG